MKYILKNIILEGQFKDNGDGTGIQSISVVTGIEGDTYNFLRTNTFNVPLVTDSISEAKHILQQAALDFIAINYPSI